MKIQNEEEIKMGLEDKLQQESKRAKIENDSYKNTNDDSLKLPELQNVMRPREHPEQIRLTMGEYQQPELSNETRQKKLNF